MLTKEVYEKIAYINGTGRNRFEYWNDKAVHPILSNILSTMSSEEQISFLDNNVIPLTKVCGSWTDWVTTLKKYEKSIEHPKIKEKKTLTLEEAKKQAEASATFLFDDTCSVLRFLLIAIGIKSEDIKQFCYELKINIFEYLLELFMGAKDGQPISDLDYKKSHLFENVLKDLLGESCFEPSKFGPYLIDKYAGKRDAALSGGADATLREWILPYAAELAFKFHYDQYNSLTKESYILLLYYKIKYFGRDLGVDDEWLEAEGITI